MNYSTKEAGILWCMMILVSLECLILWRNEENYGVQNFT